MKFSYQWLAQLVPGLSIEPAELQQLITMKTAECEGIEPVGGHFSSVIAARIDSVEALPKGKNKRVWIDAGTGTVFSVVCGAPNVRVGMVAPWVRPGTRLGEKLIGMVVIDGVESEGMLASAAELGIGRDHSGLLELDGVLPGASLPGLVPDWIIEIDNKSLTHRPDLWGHYGMAREVAAITRLSLVDPVKPDLVPRVSAAIQVHIEDHGLCPRYSALVLENVTVGPSPLWLQARLETIGLNSINNVVDVTNHALAELPQPMHAFDADKIQGDTVFVRNARSGEKLAALNGETYELHPADLVIADAAGPIAIAGVIGGADSAISESTTRVILESANFQASSVRLTSSRHKLRTDASVRFEKSLDPESTVRGLARAVELLSDVSPSARVVGGVADVYRPLPVTGPVSLPVSFVMKKLGEELTQERITYILTALGFTVEADAPGVLKVTIPSWRATKDISLKDDLVEEVGRMVGYGEITPTPPLVACVVPPANPARVYFRQIRTQLADQGFTEVYNYSFLTRDDIARFSMEVSEHLAVRNPIASELTHLRRSLLPKMFSNIVGNVRSFPEVRIFELGNEIHPASDGALPRETPHVAAALYNSTGDEEDFFELKRVVECLFPAARLSAAEALSYEHPARTAAITWQQTNIGRIAEFHPSLLRSEGIEGRAFYFDVDLSIASGLQAKFQIQYTPLRKYPTSGFDLSVVTTLRLPVQQIENELTALAGPDLAAIDFVRQYAGPPLPEGQKSVSYHLEVGALDRTMTADEVTEIRNRIIQGMRSAGFELRV